MAKKTFSKKSAPKGQPGKHGPQPADSRAKTERGHGECQRADPKAAHVGESAR